jgi:hypothetical protein
LEDFMKNKRALLLLFLAYSAAILTFVLAGCGSTSSKSDFETLIDGGSLSATDNFSKAGPSSSTKITVTPSAAPTIAPAPPMPDPASQPATVVRVAQEPQPVDISLPDGRTIKAPAGSAVTVETSDHGEATTRNQTADSHGNIVRTKAKEGAAAMAQGPSKVELKPLGDDGSGGGSDSGQGKSSVSVSWVDTIGRAFSATSTLALVLGVIGIFLILGAIVYLAMEHVCHGTADMPLAALLAGSGIAFILTAIVADKYPIFMLLLFLAMVGGAVWYVVVWKHKQKSSANAGAPGISARGAAGAE